MKFLTIKEAGKSDLFGNLGDFSELISLSIVSCPSREIFVGITSLTKLKELTITNCTNLEGTIPPEIFCFPNLKEESDSPLQELQLSHNAFSGLIPDFRPLFHLTTLRLDHNKLSGPIPRSITCLENLQVLKLNNNKLNGNIDHLVNLPHLKYLWLHNNELSCEVPDFGNLHNLVSLKLHNNWGIQGELPLGICKLAKLKELELLNTNIRFKYETNFYSLKSLTHLSLEYDEAPESVKMFVREHEDGNNGIKITKNGRVPFTPRVPSFPTVSIVLNENKENIVINEPIQEEIFINNKETSKSKEKDERNEELIKNTLAEVANKSDEEIKKMFLDGNIPFHWCKSVEHFEKKNENRFKGKKVQSNVEKHLFTLEESRKNLENEIANQEKEHKEIRKALKKLKKARKEKSEVPPITITITDS